MSAVSELTPAQIRAAAIARAEKALELIERAQHDLEAACGELSALTHGAPVWRACSKLTDRVHAFWYRVQRFRYTDRYSLDSTNVEALARRLERKERPPWPGPESVS